MLIPSANLTGNDGEASLSRRVNANSQLRFHVLIVFPKLIKKGEC